MCGHDGGGMNRKCLTAQPPRLFGLDGRVTSNSPLSLHSLMAARSQSSAAGILALLSEPEAIFKQHALTALNPLVPRFWAEISEHIALMLVH